MAHDQGSEIESTLEAGSEDASRPLSPDAAPEVVDPADDTQVDELLEFFSPLFAGTGGIDSWLRKGTPQTVVDRLHRLDEEALTRAQLNQLLVLSHEAGLSPGFFDYYWRNVPLHTYSVQEIPGYDPAYAEASAITSLAHLRWGLMRFFTDALLYFGNVRSAYRALRGLPVEVISAFFERYRCDTGALEGRGAPLNLRAIPRDERYLISEMACKSLGASDTDNLGEYLRGAYDEYVKAGNTASVSVKQLLENAPDTSKTQMTFAADSLLEDELTSLSQLEAKIAEVVETFNVARGSALQNTKLYLSMVGDLDVYVATSMRTRQDFREMADFCEEVFSDNRLGRLHVRHFDPTMSAAEGHEDKGLIECLMVKAAKALIYFAGAKESFGKDAEAAMALSQGKPVILYCADPGRRGFYRDVHPLARLINFGDGVANGWMVASTPEQVAELLARILHNEMSYELEQSKPGYLRLKETLTGSVVRLQTSDEFLRETFWNYYQHLGT
jgi:hypothetical protein